MTTLLLVLAVIQVVALIVVLALLNRRSDAGQQLESALRDESRNARNETAEQARAQRLELTNQLQQLTQGIEGRLESLRTTVEVQLRHLQASNEEKLEKMRKTVDEQLQSTLQKRLGESFMLVSKQLEAVQRGLGEMQTLAADVGGLKRVLANVKARGTFGEVQLGALLEQMLMPDQYARNVMVHPESREVVEYAVRLPGAGDGVVWLPIDSKFPQEDYLRLQAAAQSGDKDAEVAAQEALARAVLKAAKDIREKYIHPPHSTDFAILFLPTESLYAEVLRNEGLIQKLQQDCRVVLSGPSTLAALLNSLRMGFRTLAIEQRSSEVWKILAAVKSEFGKFGDVLDRVKKKLDEATNTLSDTGVRTRQIERQLRNVESLPEAEAAQLGAPDQPPESTETRD